MRRAFRVAVRTVALALPCLALAAVAPEPTTRFDRLVIHDPSSRLGILAETPDQLPSFDSGRALWSAFRQQHGASWSVWLDRRSGTPLLASGAGIRWFAAGQEVSETEMEARARQFLALNAGTFGIRADELVWNDDASAPTDADRFTAVFDRQIGGLPVEGERFVLHVVRGNLVSFGASRWGGGLDLSSGVYGEETARSVLYLYMGLGASDLVEEVEPARKVVLPFPSAGGDEIDHLAAWRFAVRVEGEPGTWVGKVDAAAGKVVAFYDDAKYAQLKGGVYPVSNDGNCADYGCELPAFPMPFMDLTVGKKPATTDDFGFFPCQKGGSRRTTTNLSGPYVRMSDQCGFISEGANCSGDIDLGTSAGTDCTIPSGHNPGDTHASRLNAYLLNRLKEKARYWLPANNWVNNQLQSRVNIGSTCNAYWDGRVNFYRSGGGCRNTGEIAGVVSHEYGHGLDQNDGGGYDNASEAYADVIAILQDRRSCVGRGFFMGGTCSAYGDTCLTCTGIRDMDWNARTRKVPATPQNFTLALCGGGGGPCGREVHCESYVPSEAIFDLAVRDLPATGLDAASSWQLAEKLFYKSRQGSGGNIFNCSGGGSDGCNANGWFNTMRVADDDDGDLSNGTPHADAIHAAFARHNIACGDAADPSNQAFSACAKLGTPAVSTSSAAGSVTLSWPAVAGASKYLVMRNEIGCDVSFNVIGTVTGTSFTDSPLPAGMTVYYQVQAQESNAACESAVSACVSVSAQ
jgi:hypothetical protein